MQIIRNAVETMAERVVHRRGLRRRGRDAVGSLAPAGEQRPLHPRRPQRPAHPPQRADRFVTEGVGLCQRRDGPIEVISPGDRVFFESGEDHWHSAAPNRFMTQIAMVEIEAGNAAAWGEHVSDEEHGAAPLIDR